MRSSSTRSTTTSARRVANDCTVASPPPSRPCCGDDPGDRLGELAYHWTQASQPADAAKAIEYALRAGDHALAKLAPDDAVAWYDQVLELIEGQPTPTSSPAARRWSASAPHNARRR